MSTADKPEKAWRGEVAEVAPRQGEALAGARLHEDGRGARADRTGDRAPTAAGADEITPGCARVSICDGTGLQQCQNKGLNINGLFTS